MSVCRVDGCDKSGRGSICSMHRARLNRTGTTDPGPSAQLPLVDRYWRRVVRGDGCWAWNGSTNNKGYARVNDRGVATYVHRLSWEIHFGPIPNGLVVMHKCDNPPCSNPDHLMLGTQADNMADAARKGRCLVAHPNQPRGEQVKTSRLTAAQVAEIRRLRAQGVRRCDVAARFGISGQHVTRIMNREAWAA